jgi:hypothetical protein
MISVSLRRHPYRNFLIPKCWSIYFWIVCTIVFNNGFWIMTKGCQEAYPIVVNSLNALVLAQKQTWRPVKQNRGSRYESTELCPPYFWQRCQKHTREKRQPLWQILLGKVDIGLLKTEARSMFITLY